jgi:uncharacterized CHY-type Zn-finger protein
MRILFHLVNSVLFLWILFAEFHSICGSCQDNFSFKFIKSNCCHLFDREILTEFNYAEKSNLTSNVSYILAEYKITNIETTRRIKYVPSRFRYYANTDASFNVERNPGPQMISRRQTTCDHCEKTVRKNQTSVSCNVCFGSYHAKCASTKHVYANVNWTCGKCLLLYLYFLSILVLMSR